VEQATLSIRESSQEISRIIEEVDSITFQKNLLALNAAVEAAKRTEEQILEAIQRSQGGVDMCARVSRNVDGIVGEGREVENATGNMGQLRQVTENIAATTEQTAASSDRGWFRVPGGERLAARASLPS
jgi:methyl-accepting chemotaxis protein